jgi:hypothetical protein
VSARRLAGSPGGGTIGTEGAEGFGAADGRGVAAGSRGERIGDSAFGGAASRRAQSTNVGQPGKALARQYAAW